MDLNKVKSLTARTMDVGKNRVKIVDEEKATQAITREDIRQLVKEKAIVIKKIKGQSRGRARVLAEKKKKGRRSGPGKRKGTKKTRETKKKKWMTKVRAQRKVLKKARPEGYRSLYKMVKAGFFKSVKQLKGFVEKR